MGPKQSTTIKQYVDILNKSVTNIMSKTTNTSSQDGSSINSYNIIVRNGGILDCDDLSSTQNINMSATTKSAMKIQNSQDLKNLMKSAIEQSVTSSSKQVQEMLATAFDMKQSTNVEMTTKLQQIVETNVSINNENQCLQMIKNLNQKNLIIENGSIVKGKKCTTNQDIAATLLSECITNTITDTLSSNEQFAKLMQTADVKQEQEAKGLNSIVDSFTSIFKTWAYAIAAIGGLIFFIIIIIVILKMTKSSSPSINSYENSDDYEDDE